MSAQLEANRRKLEEYSFDHLGWKNAEKTDN